MARWILKCDNCNFEILTHSMISDQSAESYFLPQKPVFADTEFECPNCGNKDTYVVLPRILLGSGRSVFVTAPRRSTKMVRCGTADCDWVNHCPAL